MVRLEVVQLLTKNALDAMDGNGIDDLTVAEIISACYTMTKYVTKTVLDHCTPEERARNVEQFQSAIAELYALLPPQVVN